MALDSSISFAPHLRPLPGERLTGIGTRQAVGAQHIAPVPPSFRRKPEPILLIPAPCPSM